MKHYTQLGCKMQYEKLQKIVSTYDVASDILNNYNNL